jgi:hypothetical protein
MLTNAHVAFSFFGQNIPNDHVIRNQIIDNFNESNLFANYSKITQEALDYCFLPCISNLQQYVPLFPSFYGNYFGNMKDLKQIWKDLPKLPFDEPNKYTVFKRGATTGETQSFLIQYYKKKIL